MRQHFYKIYREHTSTSNLIKLLIVILQLLFIHNLELAMHSEAASLVAGPNQVDEDVLDL